MQQSNRLGLGLRPPLQSSYGQGPSLSTLAYQQQMQNQPPPPKTISLFVGSISGGISDTFMNELLLACGTIKPFKRLITPANKPQGFGFVEYEEPIGALRALTLLNGIELPTLEDGCANKKLLVKADDKYKPVLDGVQNTQMSAEAEQAKNKEIKNRIDQLLADINQMSQDAANNGLIDKEKYVIPPHLHDLQEADLPETQRGLVISEIAQFRERAAKREREKLRDVRESIPTLINAPSGPKGREWGKPQGGRAESPTDFSRSKDKAPSGFVKERNGRESSRERPPAKTDEELEMERKEKRQREEEMSFRDRERRYEPREKTRILGIERAMMHEKNTREQEEREGAELRARLDAWDDDESDEMFYVDRARWRLQRRRILQAEEKKDNEAREYEAQEAENLRRESEVFLARQMDEMQALAEEQRKAGMLLDDGAPVRLNVSIAHAPTKDAPTKEKAVVFAEEDDEEEAIQKRKAPLVKLDFSVAESTEELQKRMERFKDSVPRDKETLFKAKVRWDGLTDLLIDRKLEPLVKRLMVKYLGELEDDDLILFVIEHLKDHKPPQKLVEGLEPVLEEEAVEFTISLWRQIIFESMAYNQGLMTDNNFIE